MKNCARNRHLGTLTAGVDWPDEDKSSVPANMKFIVRPVNDAAPEIIRIPVILVNHVVGVYHITNVAF